MIPRRILLGLTCAMFGCLEVKTEYELIHDGNAVDIDPFPGPYFEKDGEGFIPIEVTKLAKQGHYKLTRNQEETIEVRTCQIDDNYFLVQFTDNDEEGIYFDIYPCKIHGGSIYYLEIADDELSDKVQAEIAAAIPRKRGEHHSNESSVADNLLKAYKAIVIDHLADAVEKKIYYSQDEVQALKGKR